MSVASAPAAESPAPEAIAPEGTALEHGAPGWIVSPAFDLVLVSNLAWLLALAPGFVAAEGTPHIEFWQIYFLTTPHRWLTLFLVLLDPDRREGRASLFLGIAVLAAIVVLGVKLTGGAFLCLLLVDYIWNGWHFAAQHFGVLRLYACKAGGGWPRLERHGLRGFIFYVIARTAGWSTGFLEDRPTGRAVLAALDLAALAVPALLVALELRERSGPRLGKRVYLISVCGLYASLLLALHTQHRLLVLALTTASATFHALEYLALVTHYAWRRQTSGAPGVFRVLCGHWVGVLAGYILVLGLGTLAVRRLGSEWWLGFNLWASFLHYAYDGMIWKLRRPATAQALGLDPSPPGGPS